mmetsp:Transcript_37088/g.122353  ORF Transcript_37088/g.122353 Transcript_37088/m.122353 type:complete len:214 (-) Transcript_37088:27-668(-)
MRSTAARSRLDDHGSSPHSSSISMYRSDHRSSARPKSWFWCERMEAYLHVPRNSAEARAGCATPSLLRHRRASPKSRMWQRHMAAPRPTQKLDGLMSRCTQPISCIVRMASTICTPALATVRSESRRRGADFRSSDRFSPSSCIARKCTGPPSVSTPRPSSMSSAQAQRPCRSRSTVASCRSIPARAASSATFTATVRRRPSGPFSERRSAAS